MTKRLTIVIALTAILLSSCGVLGQAPAPTATLAPSATVTSVIVPTLAPATEPPAAATTETAAPVSDATATASPTAEVARPTNPPDCKNSASFVADVTIPDNTDGTDYTDKGKGEEKKQKPGK